MTNYTMRPGPMHGDQRRELAASLPQYLSRGQAAELADVHIRTVDRWIKLWKRSQGSDGLKPYYDRLTINEQPPGLIRVSKGQLLERLGLAEYDTTPAKVLHQGGSIAEAAARGEL